MKKTSQNFNKEELNRIFELAWLIFYKSPEYYTLARHQRNYEALQTMLIHKKDETSKDEKSQILALKLLDNLYKEIIGKELKTNSEKQGLDSKQVKTELYQKIFGEKPKWNSTPQMQEQPKNEIKTESEVDFDTLYDPRTIETLKSGDKNVDFESNLISKGTEQDIGDTKIYIAPIGKLKYSNAFGLQTHINRYSLVISNIENGKFKTFTKNVYTDIDLNKMNKDKNYRQAVIKQLLDLKNINKNGNEDYIGELSHKKGSKNDEYEVVYSSEEYTAIKIYNEQKERKLKEIVEEVKGEER